MNVGLIGLGNLGLPVGKNLLSAGYRLTVHDLQEESAAPLLTLGARWADSPQQVGKRSQVVITVLPTPVAVTAVVEGANGLLEGLSPGGVWIDSSNAIDE